MKKLMTVLGLMTLVATPVLAQNATDTAPLAEQAQANAGPAAHAAFASADRHHARGAAVTSQYGSESDAAIRLQLRRDPIATGESQ